MEDLTSYIFFLKSSKISKNKEFIIDVSGTLKYYY